MALSVATNASFQLIPREDNSEADVLENLGADMDRCFVSNGLL